MKKFFGVMILLLALVISGCENSQISVTTDGDEVNISATNAGENFDAKIVTLKNCSSVQVDSKISSGKLIIYVGGKEHAIDKTGEVVIDLPANESKLILSAEDNLTGEIKIRSLPKI